jgi:predicted lipoprotein with Yx(FWY)xxD motif/nitrite reductase/ring-hydroxylating ferredoxin subunit
MNAKAARPLLGLALLAFVISAGCMQATEPPAASGDVVGKTTLAPGEVTRVVAKQSPLGLILTDAKGMTLYMFKGDEAGKVSCYGQCAQNWPPLVAKGDVVAGEGIPGAFTTIERTDGLKQVAYTDLPLYYFSQDAAPGDVKGQGVKDAWYVMNPLNGPVMPAASGKPATAATNPAATATTGAQAATTLAAAPTTAAADPPGQFVARVDDVPVGTVFDFAYNGEGAKVVNFNGQFMAYVDTCPHKGSHNIALDGDVLKCPLHGSTFSPRTGDVVGGPATSALTTIPLVVSGGSIYAQ